MELLIGAIVTGILQIIKKYFGPTAWITYFLLAILSLIAAAVYYFINMYGYWDKVYQIILSAAAIYALIVRPLSTQISNK